MITEQVKTRRECHLAKKLAKRKAYNELKLRGYEFDYLLPTPSVFTPEKWHKSRTTFEHLTLYRLSLKHRSIRAIETAAGVFYILRTIKK